MTREQAEKLIENSIREAWRVYKLYNPDGQYLSMTVSRGSVRANNAHWGADHDKKLDFSQPLKQEAEAQ